MNVSFLGAGKMAEALIAAWLNKAVLRADEVRASDVNPTRLAELRTRYGIRVTASNPEAVAGAAIVFLTVKPQQLDAVLAEIAAGVTPEHLLVSIAAGCRTTYLETRLPRGRVLRVMPNIACLVGQAMHVLTRGSRAQPGDTAVVLPLLSACGRVLELPEEQFDAVTALSGSGPAFFAYVLDRLVDGAVAEGLRREDARTLAAQTMLGTAALLLERELTPAELAAAVTSAGGTTAAGRQVLENEAVATVLRETIRAAARRSRELGAG